MISDILQGLTYPSHVISSFQCENMARQGGHKNTTTLFQTAAIYHLLMLTGNVLQVAKRAPLPLWIKATLLLTPAAITKVTNWTEAENNSIANRIAYGCRDYLSPLTVIGATISQAGLIRYGKVVRGYVGLAAIGGPLFLQAYRPGESPRFSRIVRQGQDVLSSLSIAGGLVYGNWLDRCLSLSIFIWCASLHVYMVFLKKDDPKQPPTGKINLLSNDYSTTELLVDRWHPFTYKDPSLPEPPEVNFDRLLTLFEEINLEQEEAEEALSSHAKWNREPQMDNAVTYVRKGIETLVKQLKGKERGLCQLATYEEEKKKAAHVLCALEALPAHQRKAPLLRLGINSHLCPLAPKREINDLYEDLGFAPKTLEEQINHALRIRRKQLFEEMLTQDREKIKELKKYFMNNPGFPEYQTDQHFYNCATIAFGGSLGLPSNTLAKVDLTAESIAPALWLMSKCAGIEWTDYFWEQYDAKCVIEEASIAINGDWDEQNKKRVNKQVDGDKVIDWCTSKYLEAGGSQKNLGDFLEREVFVYRGAMHGKFVKLLLVDLGFLRMREPPSQENSYSVTKVYAIRF